MPCGGDFPDWRDGEDASLREWLDLLRRGILFDIEHDGFWLEEWGSRPPTLDEAHRLVGSLVAAPKLIPVYMHRMMPSEPCSAGNPVFSVHQRETIYYGFDLRDYLIHEFLAKEDVGIWPIPETVRHVPFWDIEWFQSGRWAGGTCVFDNSAGQLP